MTTPFIHYAWSYPAAYDREQNPFGWSGRFAGDLGRANTTIRENAGKLGTQGVLIRGAAGCRLPRWPVGRTYEASARPGRPIESGVLTSCALPPDFLERRNAMLRQLAADGFVIILHVGPAVTEEQAVQSACLDAMSGAAMVAVDSSGRNDGEWVGLQLRCLEHLGKLACLTPGTRPLVEPTAPMGHEPRPALANVRFIDEEVAAGRPVSGHVAWLNDPTEEQREDPGRALAGSIAAGVAGYAVPAPVMLGLKR